MNHIGFIMVLAMTNRCGVPDIEKNRSDEEMSMSCDYVSGDDSREGESNAETL